MISLRIETTGHFSDATISFSWGEAILALIAAAIATGMPILGHAVHPFIGIVSGILFALLYAVYAPALAILTLLFSFIFQNLIVSLFITWIPTKEDLDLVRGYNFLSVAIVWISSVGTVMYRNSLRQALEDRFISYSTIVLTIIGAYFAVGLVFYGTNAIIYLRNIATPVLCFHIIYFAFSSARIETGKVVTLLGLVLIFCGFMEFLFRDEWLSYTNSRIYWEVLGGYNWETLAYDKAASESGIVASDLTDTFEITFFNSPLFQDFGTVMRMFGPNMHAISFSYCLAFFAIFALYRGYFIQAAAFAVLMFLCSAKGPLILFILISGSWCVAKLLGIKLAFYCHVLVLTVYALVGIRTGLSMGDFHVLGLMAGFQDFFGNPIGYGLGAGGVYSAEFASIDWYAAQAEGRTPFPVESSIGVLLYQMGVAAFALLAFYGWLSWKMMQLSRRTGNALHIATCLALLSMIANGLFQEEAFFSPLTLVLYVSLAGAIFGAARRERLFHA